MSTYYYGTTSWAVNSTWSSSTPVKKVVKKKVVEETEKEEDIKTEPQLFNPEELVL